MKSFKTSVSHLVTQGLLLAALAAFTFQPQNFEAILRLPVLLIVDVIVLVFFISSFFRKVVIEGDTLTARSIWKKTSINMREISYAQSLSAFARWVMIFNDGKRTVVVTSLLSGFAEIADVVKSQLPESEKGKLDSITPLSVARKKRTYNAVMIMLFGIVCYGIVRNFLGYA